MENRMQEFFKKRWAYLLGFFISYSLVGLALIIQVKYHLDPCPLCISQRIILMCLGLAFLIAALVPQKRKLYTLGVGVIHIALALSGAGVAIRHWWIQAHKGDMIVDCGVDFGYMFENFPLRKALMLVFRGTGDCATIDWTFLGLSIPQLSLISFLGLAVYAVLIMKSRR
jgi:protein dithiol:quinone oxidoreductase